MVKIELIISSMKINEKCWKVCFVQIKNLIQWEKQRLIYNPYISGEVQKFCLSIGHRHTKHIFIFSCFLRCIPTQKCRTGTIRC